MDTIWIVLLVAAGALILLVLVLFAMGKGSAVTSFFDFLITRFKIFLGLFGLINLKDILGDKGSKDMQEIKAENERIKAELEKLKERLKEADETLQRERAKHEQEIARLNELIKANDAKIKDTEAKINLLRSQTSIQWFNSLPKTEKDKLLAEIRKDIKWE